MTLGCSPSQVITSPPVPVADSAAGPKNIILMIGDGMGLSQITAGIYSSRRKLNFERFKSIGLQKTHCKDELITDSAASAAAMARGIKADYNTFGTSTSVKAPRSIIEEVDKKGWATGIAVTSSVTHATPAAFYSYQLFRNQYEDIAKDFMEVDVDYVVGGGKKYFDRRENDDRNLIEEMTERGYRVQSYLDGELEEVSINRQEKFAFFTADAEPLSHTAGRTYFVTACRRGAEYLSKRSEKGFFFLIESSQIDWGGHANVGDMIIDEVLEFDQAIGRMLDFADKDGNTLVIVTADHETGGFAIVQEDPDGELVIGFNTKTHTATAVPVFAYGPGAELFQGIYDNTELHTKMRQALRL